MWKTILISLIAIFAGFLGGTYYIQRDIEVAHSMSVAVRVIRQDKVLTYLEQGDFATAKRVQAEFLKSSLLELELGHRSSWPTEVQAIAAKRKAQLGLR